MHTLRTKGLQGTDWSRAQFDQIQLRVLKVGARIEELKTKIRVHFPSSFPLQGVYARVFSNLRGLDLGRSPWAQARQLTWTHAIRYRGHPRGYWCAHLSLCRALGRWSAVSGSRLSHWKQKTYFLRFRKRKYSKINEICFFERFEQSNFNIRHWKI